MQYNQENEKAAMMNTPHVVVPRALALAEDREVQRTRKILIIILGVCLALSVFSLSGAIFGSGTTSDQANTQRSAQVGQAILAIIFYGFGIFVAHRYSALGLRIFAWLIIIELVLLGAMLGLIIIGGIFGLAAASASGDAQFGGVIAGAAAIILIIALIVCIAVFVLSIIIIKLSFKLARLIEAHKSLTTQPV